MPNEITQRFDASAAATITLASLASSTVGVGRQGTLVDNTGNKYGSLLIHAKITNGTSPTANSIVALYLIRSDNDGTEHRDDGAGTSDAGLTVLNAQLIGTLRSSGTSDSAMLGTFVVHDPGPEWTIAVVNSTGVALHATGGNHWIRYTGLNPDIQSS